MPIAKWREFSRPFGTVDIHLSKDFRPSSLAVKYGSIRITQMAVDLATQESVGIIVRRTLALTVHSES